MYVYIYIYIRKDSAPKSAQVAIKKLHVMGGVTKVRWFFGWFLLVI